jgi:osmotically-inducible protein OsmY
MNHKSRFLLVSVLAVSLQGCFFVAGAAAGAAAIAVVYDHRNVDNIISDQKIARSISHAISDDPELHGHVHINVTSFGTVVLLTGEAPTTELRQQVEADARKTPGIRRIYNAISIQGPTSGLTYASDTWITTKIKTEMLAAKGLKSASIKVVTENGTVYLLGVVTRAQEKTIVNIARQANGVQRVVKIFQYEETAVTHPQNAQELQPIVPEESAS